MKSVNGWWLPDDDSYFAKFIEGGPIKNNGFQREHLLEAFKHVRKWDCAVDAGAHVGFWAKDMAERFKKVYCFEPSPKTLACLAKNMAEFENVHVSHCALGDESRRCSIARDDRRAKNSGSEYIKHDVLGSLDMATLDSLDLLGCDLLKVDVEGYELAVLKGARKTLKKFRPVVIMECDKKFAQRRYGWSDYEAQGYLESFGYEQVAHMRPDKVFVSNEAPAEEQITHSLAQALS